MTQDIVQAAQKERERLIAELHKSPTYQQLCTIEGLLKVYGANTERPLSVSVSVPKTPIKKVAAPAVQSGGRKLGKRETIEYLAVDLVARQGKANNVEIDKHLKDNKITDISRGNLSAYLSRTPQIKFDRDINCWVLKKNEPQQESFFEDNKSSVNGVVIAH